MAGAIAAVAQVENTAPLLLETKLTHYPLGTLLHFV
jgi:hypothetical protein